MCSAVWVTVLSRPTPLSCGLGWSFIYVAVVASLQCAHAYFNVYHVSPALNAPTTTSPDFGLHSCLLFQAGFWREEDAVVLVEGILRITFGVFVGFCCWFSLLFCHVSTTRMRFLDTVEGNSERFVISVFYLIFLSSFFCFVLLFLKCHFLVSFLTFWNGLRKVEIKGLKWTKSDCRMWFWKFFVLTFWFVKCWEKKFEHFLIL